MPYQLPLFHHGASKYFSASGYMMICATKLQLYCLLGFKKTIRCKFF